MENLQEKLENSFKQQMIDMLPKEKKYSIYHCSGPKRFTTIESQPREFVGFVMAHSIEGAYIKSQNGQDPWNMSTPCRSTSVGDVIQDCDSKHYMVCGIGFKVLEIEKKQQILNIISMLTSK